MPLCELLPLPDGGIVPEPVEPLELPEPMVPPELGAGPAPLVLLLLGLLLAPPPVPLLEPPVPPGGVDGVEDAPPGEAVLGALPAPAADVFGAPDSGVVEPATPGELDAGGASAVELDGGVEGVVDEVDDDVPLVPPPSLPQAASDSDATTTADRAIPRIRDLLFIRELLRCLFRQQYGDHLGGARPEASERVPAAAVVWHCRHL